MITTTHSLCDWCDTPATVAIADAAALQGHHRACPVHAVAAHLPHMLAEVA